MNIKMLKTLSSFTLSAALVGLVGCGGASTSPENEENPPPAVEEQDNTLVYNGEPPEGDDVLNFKLYIWDLLAREDRCGECHIEGGTGSPAFVRRDDINLAYDIALPDLIDLESPSSSLIYTRVADDNHEAWDAGAADTILTAINRWRSATGASATEIVLDPPSEPESVGEIFVFTDTALAQFESTIYALMTDEAAANCNRCHAEDTADRQQPFHSSISSEVAFSEVRSLIELDVNSVGESRLVERMEEGHFTWANPNPGNGLSDAEYSAQQMEQAIRDFLNSGAVVQQRIPDEWVVTSAASFVSESSQVISAGGRVETNVIALYQFKESEGQRAYDVSGVDPAIHLDFTGDVEWLGSWGIRFSDNAIAIGDNISSQKLNTQIRLTGEYSIETWVVPGNVSQEESRIVTYSGNDSERNFSLMQNIYDYDFYTRNTDSDINGEPLLNTPSGDEVLQATLQHVVATYDPIAGRSIYVNGNLIVQDDRGGDINDWSPSYNLALGNELGSTDDWEGTIRMLAIHNRVLDEDQVRTNFDAGVGQKYFMYFSVSEHLPYEEAFVVFTVELFDDNAYLFQEPFLIVEDEGAAISSPITFQGMRIGINGKEAVAGQSFASMNVTIDQDYFDSHNGAPPLWGDPSLPYGNGDENNSGAVDGDEVPENPGPAGTVIAVEEGVQNDVFFLTFEQVGAETYTREAEAARPVPDIQISEEEQADVGIRMFDEIFHNMSALSTVPAARVYDYYSQEIRRSLPSAPDASSFLASQQSAITQLSLAYCNALIDDADLSSEYFGDYDDLVFGVDYDGQLSSDDQDNDNIYFVGALMDKMLIGRADYSTSADVADVQRRLNNEGAAESADVDSVQGLIQALMTDTAESGAVDSDQAKVAVCTSVLASAAMLMQ